MNDIFKHFFLTSIQHNVGFRLDEITISEILDSPELQSFLFDAKVFLLLIKHGKDDNILQLFNDFNDSITSRTVVIFLKRDSLQLTAENLHHQVIVTNIPDSLNDYLYQILNKLYIPLILSEKSNLNLDSKLRNLIFELDAELSSSLNKERTILNMLSDPDMFEESNELLLCLISPVDELSYWTHISQEAPSFEMRERALAFKESISLITKEFTSFSLQSLSQIVDSLDFIYSSLDELWKNCSVKPPYPEVRMCRLVEVCSNSLLCTLQEKMSSLDIWFTEFSNVKKLLDHSIHICNKWLENTELFTGHIWKKDDLHSWQGPVYICNNIKQFVSLLDELNEYRSLQRQARDMLSFEESHNSGLESIFDCFKGLKPLQLSTNSSQLWHAAVNNFFTRMKSADKLVAYKLRDRFSRPNVVPIQLLREFERFKTFLSHTAIKVELLSEREILLAYLTNYLASLNERFQQISILDISSSSNRIKEGKNLTPIVNVIVFLTQLCTKINFLVTAEYNLDDLSTFRSFQTNYIALKENINSAKTEKFEMWCREVISKLDIPDSPFDLNIKNSVLKLVPKDGRLIVLYPDRLVQLLREVRILTALGFMVPPIILKCISIAQRCLRYGLLLKQISNFYNSIDQQIIPSQQPLMISASLSLESLITKPNIPGISIGSNGQISVSWECHSELEAYIDKLQKASEAFCNENRKLRKIHCHLVRLVEELFSIELLKHQSKWKRNMTNIRDLILKLEIEKLYDPSHMQAWRIHWDHQLYKALENCYSFGLQYLNASLSEIKIDIVIRHGFLQFKPSFEEVRAKYYRELKKFLLIPRNFKGVDKNDSRQITLFHQIISRKRIYFSYLFCNAENLLLRLSRVIEHYEDWVVFESSNIEGLIETCCHDISDYERSFKLLKLKGRAAEKLPNLVKIDCISVSALPVKSLIENQIQHIYDSLITSLQRSVKERVLTVESFISEAKLNFSNTPHSMEEISEAKRSQKKFIEKRNEINPLLLDIESRIRLIHLVAGSSRFESSFELNQRQLMDLHSNWDQFDAIIESQGLIINEQFEVLKGEIKSRVEQLRLNIENFSSVWEKVRPNCTEIDILNMDVEKGFEVLNCLNEKKKELLELREVVELIQIDSKHFSIQVPEFPKINSIFEDFESVEAMWKVWQTFNTEYQQFVKKRWIGFRNNYNMFEEFIDIWYKKLRGYADRNQMLLFNKMIQDLDRFVEIVPLLKHLCGDHFSLDHWVELFNMLDLPRNLTLETLEFGEFLKIIPIIITKADCIRELNIRAQGEISIRDALKELEIWGISTTFSFSTYITCDKVDINVIKEWRKLVTEIADNICLLQSLKDSPYYQPFSDKAFLWEDRLLTVDTCVQRLNQIQRKWVYLEPVFGSGSFTREYDRFKQVDNDFRSILTTLYTDKYIISLVNKSGFVRKLDLCLDQILKCQKALNDFLEEKRILFPRFFFIGDEDLLEILGQSTKSNIIQSHLQKLYAGINTVTFSDMNDCIKEINSLDGEVVPLANPILVTAVIEDWLNDLTNEMKTTLKADLSHCTTLTQDSGYITPSENNFSSQVLCLSEIIQFTTRCQHAISSGRLSELLIELEAQLRHLSQNKVDSGWNTKLNVLELKRKSLVLDTIHYISIVKYLLSDHICENLDNWKWQKQLRYYHDSISDDYYVKMVDASFSYTFEYQGNAPKLVQTPLTDKCFLTLTQGMLIGMGGNPYGPAGTGKTESVKALGALLGRQVLVFNCDEAIDVKSMGRIFIGIVRSGAWGCFDEFNRLEEVVLSAISMQIQVIQKAIKEKDPFIQLMEQSIALSHHSGIFITLNPAGKGYGGRQKLPDNLKQLFLPVAMSEPDNHLIAEVLFYSEGFRNSEILAKKLVQLFALSRELLSQQQHYDWGLRALKTVLKGAGSLFQKYRNHSKGESKADLFTVETNLLIQAIRLNTLSKLTFIDSRRFEGLLIDIFPGISFQDGGYPDIEENLKKYLSKKHLIKVPSQMLKCLELYEQLHRRMGVLIVGPSGSGKSFLWKTLSGTLLQMGQSINIFCLNPKAIHRTILLGSMDQDTREWSDGILTLCSRKVCQESNDVDSWIVCDGDIDPEWIESLNSVLDDNRLLTMPSGERIQFGPNVHFIFETNDIIYASPATISRMGIIFLSEEGIDVKAVVQSYIKNNLDKLPTKQLIFIIDNVNDYFYRCFDFVISDKELVLDCSIVGIVNNGLSQLETVNCSEQFALAMIRGFGSILGRKRRATFAKEVLEMLSLTFPNQDDPCDIYYDVETKSLKSYNIINDISESYLLEKSLLNSLKFPLIKTLDVQKNIDLFFNLLVSDRNSHFILAGPDGCGKETVLFDLIKGLPTTKAICIYCNSETRPHDIITKLFEVCISFNTNKGKTLRPKGCDKLVLLIKGINFPKPDKWGTVQLIAFLQQVATYDGFYHTTLEWIALESIQIVATLNPIVTLGRYAVSTRLTSILRICYIPSPESAQLHVIYGSLLVPVFRKNRTTESPSRSFLSNWSTTSNIHALAGSMVSVYDQVSRKFTKDQSSYYHFTPKHLTEWSQQFSFYINTLEGIIDEEYLLQVFKYEANRIFKDRLNKLDLNIKFDHIVKDVLMKDWKINIQILPESHEESYYCSMPNETNGDTLAKYLYPIHESKLSKSLSEITKNYMKEVESMDIYLFSEVISNFAKLDRVLTKPGGSLLLLGRSGAGRHLSLKLSAFHHQIEIFTPRIGREYGIKRFKQDIKLVLNKCGVENHEIIFLLEDYQLVHPCFLDMVNSLLCSGEVPSLFSNEEMKQIFSSIKDDALENGYGDNLDFYFYSRIKRKLHITLILDISSSQINSIFDSYPALYNCCTIIVMDSWSKNTIHNIPKLHMQSMIPQLLEFIDLEDLSRLIVRIFSSNIKESNPLKLFSLTRLFVKLYRDQFVKIDKLKKKLDAGVQKIGEATQKVSDLKDHANTQRSLLSAKQDEADSALEMITKSMHQASEQKFEMETLAQKKFEEKHQLEERKRATDIQLSEIMPLIEQSRSAVSSIKPESIAEIRVLRAPPDVIRDILEGVLMLLGIYDTSWHSIKTFLGKRGVREDICQFDARNITKDVRVSVEEFVEGRKKSFETSVARRASVAAAPLANWVISILKYSHVLESIKPLEDEKSHLSKNLAASDLRMKQLVAAVSVIDEDILKMKSKFEQFTEEAAKLRIDVLASDEIITAAENLVGKLIDEQVRWGSELKSLEIDRDTMSTRCLLSSAYILYLGRSEEIERLDKMSLWKSYLNFKGEFSVSNFLVNESQQLNWKHAGLPSDELSISNIVILKHTLHCPLIIDPSQRASEWLKKHMSTERLEVVHITDNNFVTRLELCVRFGKKIIIQNIAKIEPILYSLIRREICIRGSGLFVYIGEKQVEYNEDFRLFLISRNLDHNIPPDIVSHLTIINFSFTQDGLSLQLLALTIQEERPELENKKKELLFMEESLRLDLSSLEESLLQTLAASEGSLLENKSLLISLNETKEKSINISTALIESKQLQNEIDIERNIFLPFAQNASRMYFILITLSQMNHMYRYSLESFISLFKKAIDSRHSEKETNARISLYNSRLQSIVFNFVARSLFDNHFLSFSIYFVYRLYPKLFGTEEWEYFCGIKSVNSDEIQRQFSSEEIEIHVPKWFDSERINNIIKLKLKFPSLYSCLELQKEEIWTEFMRSSCCEDEIPQSILKRLTSFQVVLLIQILRPDRLQSAMEKFCARCLGFKQLYSSPLQFIDLYSESNSKYPVLFIVSPGVNPSHELYDLADAIIGLEHYFEMPMGQGQADIALKRLRQCAKTGDWLCLKNLHLVIDWLPEIEKFMLSIEPHEKFRLFLISEQHHLFPINLLNMCLKISFEIKPGVKNNLFRSYDQWTSSYISLQNNPIRAQIIFILTWFHVLLQERCNFIPIGWSKFYAFSLSDLRAAANLVDRLAISKFESGGRILWLDHLHGVLENAIYGGRIDNQLDFRIFKSFIHSFFSKNVLFGRGSFGPFKSIPHSIVKKDFLEIIDKISYKDNPFILNLPSNIDFLSQRLKSDQVLSQLKVMVMSELYIDELNLEKFRIELAPIFSLWKKLNQTAGLISRKLIDISKFKELPPLLDFIIVELNKAFELIKLIHSSLISIKYAIEGGSQLSNEIMIQINALIKHLVPSQWRDKWDGPEDASQYLKFGVKKTFSLEKWFKMIQDGTFFTSPLNLSHLFCPGTFLCAFRQHISRINHICITELKLTCSWKGKISNSSLLINGLYLEGCLFDGKQITPTKLDSSSFVPVPQCYISWIESNRNDIYSDEESVTIPFYSSQKRDHLLTLIKLPCGQQRNVWIESGAALFIYD